MDDGDLAAARQQRRCKARGKHHVEASRQRLQGKHGLFPKQPRGTNAGRQAGRDRLKIPRPRTQVLARFSIRENEVLVMLINRRERGKQIPDIDFGAPDAGRGSGRAR